MRKRFVNCAARAGGFCLACCVLLSALCLGPSKGGAAAAPPAFEAQLARLVRAYPEARLEQTQSASGVGIRMGGEVLLFSPADGCPEAHPDQLADSPLCAMFAQPYPRGAGHRLPEKGFEPGRVRNEAFLKRLYGHDAEAVRANCVSVPFLGEQLLFNARHGAAAALARVGRKLEALAAYEPGLRAYILPTGGAFFWRSIQGSGRLSAHSFGIAVDLNVQRGPYWRWSGAASTPVRDAVRNYPQSIVDAFESEGFIWGGKWHSFDFMHFEYRPELLTGTPFSGSSERGP